MNEENIKSLEQVIRDLMFADNHSFIQIVPKNIIGVTLNLYDMAQTDETLKTLLRNMTDKEINSAYLNALLPY